MKIVRTLGLASLLVCLVAIPASWVSGNGDGANKEDICHVPPGNPDNAHVISISSSAVPAHLDHGDCLDWEVEDDTCVCD